MSQRLLIAAERAPLRAALLDSDGAVEGFWQFGAGRESVVGARYLGRVTTIDRGLDAAFVDIGLAKPGFLPLARAAPTLVEGESILVEVTRDPVQGKGARLTARLADAARPPPGARPPLCLGKSDPLLELLKRLGAVQVETDTRRLAETLADAAAGAVIHRPQREWSPSLAEILAEAGEALEPRVALPSGGWLLIEPCRTLTVIDVNSGEAKSAEAERNRLKTDLEAARAIARQLRLRHIGGIIVIDFIDLERAEHRRQVVEALRAAVADDWEYCQVDGMSRLCLVEMTRRRGGPTLAEMLEPS